jgi:hypothetical protein
MGVLLLENMFDLDQNIITLFAVILIFLILLPIIVPILLVFFSEPKNIDEEQLLQPSMVMQNETGTDNAISKHVFDDKNKSSNLEVPPRDMVQFHARVIQAVTSAVKKIKQKNGPQRGEDFTLTQALVEADFCLMFLSIILGCGSGLTMINNMGQICQSLGDNNVNVYVSVISISNFLGRVGGGYFSEVIVRYNLYRLFSFQIGYL